MDYFAKHIIIIENGMYDRYKFFINNNNIEPIVLDFMAIEKSGKAKCLLKKLKMRSCINAAVDNLASYVQQKQILSCYVSCAEGFYAHNIIKKLKIICPNLVIIGLQHGLMGLRTRWHVEFFRKAVNWLSCFVIDVYLYGVGFGGKLADYYIVYCEDVKKYFIERGWDECNVCVDLDLLKGEFKYLRAIRKKANANTALLLLQPLYQSGVCSKFHEEYLVNSAINYILSRHENLIIKEHPSALNKINLRNDRIRTCNELTDAFIDSDVAYSFFSTALLDAKVSGLKTVALYSKKITTDHTIYKNFDVVINMDVLND